MAFIILSVKGDEEKRLNEMGILNKRNLGLLCVYPKEEEEKEFIRKNFEYLEMELFSPFDEYNIRNVLKPYEKDFVWVSADYSKMEIWFPSVDVPVKFWLDNLKKGVDLHKEFAKKIFKKNNISKEERQLAKQGVFASLYNLKPRFVLMREYNLSEEVAKKIEEEFKKVVPEFIDYQMSQINMVKRNGYVKTLLNVREYFKKYIEKYGRLNANIINKILNYRIQGSCAEVLKMAMVRLFVEFEKKGWYPDKIGMVFTIHDELDFVIHKSILKEALYLIKNVMEYKVEKMEKYFRNLKPSIEINIGESFGFVFPVNLIDGEVYVGDKNKGAKLVFNKEKNDIEWRYILNEGGDK